MPASCSAYLAVSLTMSCFSASRYAGMAKIKRLMFNSGFNCCLIFSFSVLLLLFEPRAMLSSLVLFSVEASLMRLAKHVTIFLPQRFMPKFTPISLVTVASSQSCLALVFKGAFYGSTRNSVSVGRTTSVLPPWCFFLSSCRRYTFSCSGRSSSVSILLR